MKVKILSEIVQPQKHLMFEWTNKKIEAPRNVPIRIFPAAVGRTGTVAPLDCGRY